MSSGLILDPLVAVPRMAGSRAGNNIGRLALAPVSTIRPNNAVQYAVGDLYGQPMQLANVRRVAGGGVSIAAGISVESTKLNFVGMQIWAFSAAPDARADNDPFAGTLSDAEVATLLAVNSVSTPLRWTGAGAFNVAASDGGNWMATAINAVNLTIFNEAAAPSVLAGRDVWIVVTLSAIYTPDPLERLTLYPTYTHQS